MFLCRLERFNHLAYEDFLAKIFVCGLRDSSDYSLLPRVTEIIRTRQKCSIKAIFVAFAVALRQQGCHLKTTNLIFTPSIFDALQFIVCRFGLNRGKNAVNPFGLTSILTKSKGKSAAINRGSDYFRYPMVCIVFFAQSVHPQKAHRGNGERIDAYGFAVIIKINDGAVVVFRAVNTVLHLFVRGHTRVP